MYIKPLKNFKKLRSNNAYEKIMDRIIIRNLKLETLVGIYPKEKKTRQNIILNIIIFCELRKAGKSDRLEDTVDYKALKNMIVDFVEKGKFNLIEAVAEGVAKICLSNPCVSGVRISIDKPGALTRAESVAVEIERHRNNPPE